jgi:FMN phosphatase YigB (HAD superfamily)
MIRMNHGFLSGLELVIFDVDGTLYHQSKLRKIMFFKIISYYLLRPWKFKELFILYHFRKEREKRAGFTGVNLQEEQYIWCAQKLNVKIETVKDVIDKWIFTLPNDSLKSCMYPGVSKFIADLKLQGAKTAIYSDYNSKNKLKKMGLYVDLEVSSTDPEVNSFKPLPDGLLLILSEMNISNKKNCLYIGDRFELDGLCAKNAGIPFLLVDKAAAPKDFYFKLSSQFIKKNTN